MCIELDLENVLKCDDLGLDGDLYRVLSEDECLSEYCTKVLAIRFNIGKVHINGRTF